jgi:diguanylate cyclase (GGDEF)-like protein
MYKSKLSDLLGEKLNTSEKETLLKEIMALNKDYLTDRNYEMAFYQGPVGHIVMDYQFTVHMINKLGMLILGEEPPVNMRQLIHGNSLDLYDHYTDRVLKSSFSIPIHLTLIIDGQEKYVKLISNKMDEKWIQSVIIDESFERTTMNQMELIGFKDPLTGLYNRRFFHEEMSRLDVDRNYPIGLIMADVNGLKLINDAFGHHIGDELITKTARVLSKACREDDIVARIGGDEFAIILPKTEQTEINGLLDRIKTECKHENIEDIQLSIAMGSTIKKYQNDDFDHMFKRAEDEMYKDKLLSSSSQRIDIVNGILATLHEKHERESGHSKDVGDLMEEFGIAMGFGHARLNKVKSAGLLHDIGKISIDYSILELSRPLTNSEFEMVKKHSEVGYRILKATTNFGDIAEFVLYHHERVDGQGYPTGLKGSEIPLEARMLGICDAYSAMTSESFYKDKMTSEEAKEELLKNAGSQFDKLLVDIFISKVI